jgi:DNA polymerase-1
MGLSLPPWHLIEDTVYLAYLDDPNAEQLGLKILSEKILNAPADADDALRDWIFTHIKGAKRAPTKWGRFIAKAPGRLVGKYACNDVDRTLALWKYYVARGIQREPYDRERRLLPVLLGMEQRGVPVDVPGLQADRAQLEKGLKSLNRWLHRKLKDNEVNLDSKEELADAMEWADLVTEWIITAKGNRSVSAPNMREVGVEKKFVDAIELRSLMKIQLNTFVNPWLEMAEEMGKIYCTWNAVRSADVHDKKQVGARTGRLSSSPNFQNVPVRERGLSSPVVAAAPVDLRSRIMAPRGYKLICGDQAQQELRVLAHFAGGDLAQSYRDNPKFDLHAQVQDGAPVELQRWQAKILFFRRIYGSGIQGIADTIHVDYDVAKDLKRSLGHLVPGMNALDSLLQKKQHCVTWGGRFCPVEPQKYVEKFDRWMDFSYKLLNTLIQGSSADIIKEVMINYSEHPNRCGQLLLSVHDELVALVRSKLARSQRKVFLGCMEGIKLDVPMLADADIGKTWKEAKPK